MHSHILESMNRYTHISLSIFLILSIFFLPPLQSFANQAEKQDCDDKSWYARYVCSIKNTCSVYDQHTNIPSYDTQKAERSYQEWYNLYIAKALYRKNMNNIYKCAILNAQNSAFYRIRTEINITNSNDGLFSKRIQEQQTRLEQKIAALDCNKAVVSDTDLNIKKSVLEESSYEMCRYLHFLDYIRDTHVLDIWNLIKDREISQQVQWVFERDPQAWIDSYLDLYEAEEYNYLQKNYTINQILELQINASNELYKEREHTKKVYEVAYQTFANYELNMIVHILFDMLENDFRQFRNSLYAMLKPINQVAYKIPNAMSE